MLKLYSILLTSPNSASFLGFLIRWKLEASRGPGPSTAASKVVEQGPLRALQKEVLTATPCGLVDDFTIPKKWPCYEIPFGNLTWLLKITMFNR